MKEEYYKKERFLENKLTIPIILGIFGFIVSFFLSLISGSSFSGILFKSLFSTLLLGGLGYLLVYLLDKYGNESSTTQNRENTFNRTNNPHNDINNSQEKMSFVDDKEDKFSGGFKSRVSDKIAEEDERPISYEDIFSKLTDEEKINTKEESVENSELKDQDMIKRSVLEEMKQEKEKETIEIDLSNQTEIIAGDTDLNPNSISAEDAAKISATSKMSSLAGEVKGIDDKYIYFTKGSKIENKPEKIAKVIKEMLKNE